MPTPRPTIGRKPGEGYGGRLGLGRTAGPRTPLLELRERLRITQEHLALLAGVSRRAVIRIEWARDLARLTIGDLLRVSGALGVAPTDLIPGLGVAPATPRIEGIGLELAQRLAAQQRRQRARRAKPIDNAAVSPDPATP